MGIFSKKNGMIEDHIGANLHQKKFRGETLTQQELEQLEAWYIQQDYAKSSILGIAQPADSINQLRDQISGILAQLTQHIQSIAQENNEIRQENARLFELLAKNYQI